MPQRSPRAHASPSPLPRPPRVPCFDTSFDTTGDHEPSVIVLDELFARDTLEVVEEDIETGVFDPRAVEAHVRASRKGAALSHPRPRLPLELEKTEPALVLPRPPTNAPMRAAEPHAGPGARVSLLAILLGVLAFFAGWRATGGATWLDHATLGEQGDHVLARASGLIAQNLRASPAPAR